VKYFEILHIGLDLDHSYLKNKLDSVRVFQDNQLGELKKCVDLVTSFNNQIGECMITKNSIRETFMNGDSYKTQIDYMLSLDIGLTDPNIIHAENGFVLTKEMVKKLPKHVYFQPFQKNYVKLVLLNFNVFI
jgi:hypothetical protein